MNILSNQVEEENNDLVKRWYCIQTVQKMEEQCKTGILQRIKSMKMEEHIFQVFIPKQTKVEKTKKGKEVTKEENIFPGYIFVQMIYTPDSWFIVRNTPLVTGFLGSSGGGAKPVPLTDEEMIPILKQGGMKIEYNVDFAVGDEINVIAGSFVGRTGIIQSIDYDKQTVTIEVEIFGRPTPTEISFNEIKK